MTNSSPTFLHGCRSFARDSLHGFEVGFLFMKRMEDDIGVGDRFAMWVITKRLGWFACGIGFKYEAKCDCGRIGTPTRANLVSGKTRSCGCQNWGRNRERARSGMAALREYRENGTYNCYMGMISRCYNKSNPAYHHYGGRGITVCERWRDSIENFLADMGERLNRLTIERKDNDGNYCKENCRWATRKEQQNNRRVNRLLTLNGETKTVSQWAATLGLSELTVRSRLNNGWSHERALTEPIKKRGT